MQHECVTLCFEALPYLSCSSAQAHELITCVESIVLAFNLDNQLWGKGNRQSNLILHWPRRDSSYQYFFIIDMLAMCLYNGESPYSLERVTKIFQVLHDPILIISYRSYYIDLTNLVIVIVSHSVRFE